MSAEEWVEITEDDLPNLLKGDMVRWSYDISLQHIEITAEVRGHADPGVSGGATWPLSMEEDRWGDFSRIARTGSGAENFRIFVNRAKMPAPTAPLIFARQVGPTFYEGEGRLMVKLPAEGKYCAVKPEANSWASAVRVMPEGITRWVEAKAVVA